MSSINWNNLKASPNGFVLGSSYNNLIDLIRSIEIASSPDYNINRNLGGTKLNINFPPVHHGTPITPFPFMLTDVSDADSGKVTVSPGTYNNIPPMIGGVELIPPHGTPIPILTLDYNSYVVYVHYSFSFDSSGNITGYSTREILATDSSSPPSNAVSLATDGSGTADFYETISFVGVNDVTLVDAPPYTVDIFQNIKSSQTFSVCGGGISHQITS